MILHSDESLALGAAAVVEEVEGGGPGLLAELAFLQELCPLGRPEVVAEDFDVVLEVLYVAVLHAHAYLIPLSCRLGVLWLGGNHVVEGTGHAVAVLAELGVGVAFVVQNLALGGGDVYGLYSSVLGICYFAGEVEDAGVASLSYLPFHLEFEVGAELVGEDNIAALTLGLAVEEDGAVLHLPFGGYVVFAIAAPAC